MPLPLTLRSAGDTIAVQAGTYTNDWLNITHDLALKAIGGMVVMNTANAGHPPNGKAMITETGNVAISGFDISGVSVSDSNGAAIRYEGGDLTLVDCFIHDNQEGLLGGADANGTITINHSEFAFNGDGSGSTHGIYVGAHRQFHPDRQLHSRRQRGPRGQEPRREQYHHQQPDLR